MIDDILLSLSNEATALCQALVDMENSMITTLEHGDAIESELLWVNQKLQSELRDRVIAERRLKTVLEFTLKKEIE